MGDGFREVTTRSWGQRLAGAFGGAIVGIVMVPLAVGLLWWNEGRSVDRLEALATGRGQVVTVPAAPIDPAHDGRLVHISGLATTGQELADTVFPVRRTAIRLTRDVRMYQWQESKESRTEKELGGSERTETVYRYAKAWSADHIDSSAFRRGEGHENPGGMPLHSDAWQADRVTVGAFRLAEGYVDRIGNEAELKLTPEMLAALPADMQGRYRIQSNSFVTGDLASPQVGDLQVRFAWVAPTDVSAIGRQTGDRLTAFATPTGELEILDLGYRDPETMFKAAEDENTVITWIVRVAGIFLIGLGIFLLLSPLARLGDVVPVIGSLLGAGAALVAVIVALPLGFTVIALAWLAFRPLLGLAMLALAGLAIGGGILLLRRRRRGRSPAGLSGSA
ncbi:MAG: TMEM43 family protein [Sneathiellaceae bacterium]